MRQSDSPYETYRQILLPRRSAEIIGRYEALTEAEVRSRAISILEDPVFQWLLVDLQEQAIQAIRIAPPGPDRDWQCFVLTAVDQLLDALIGKVAQARELPTDGGL